MKNRMAVFGLFVATIIYQPFSVSAVTSLSPDFHVETVAQGLFLPTQMAFAPDGRIFVAEKDGAVRLFKNGALLPTPVIRISNLNNYGDRGLLGLALDPDFLQNGYLYLMYTYENTPGNNYTGPKTNRLVRVTVVGDTASEASMVVLLGTVGGDANSPSCKNFAVTDDCIPADSQTHAGGGLSFGSDGKLYASLGDGAEFNFADSAALRALNLDSLAGKIIRINKDGTAPSDNPFWNGDSHANRSRVWTYGHRNSLRFSFRPANQSLYFGDVGWYTWEEINVGKKGGNFGWPCREGFGQTPEYNCTTSNYIDPLYVYDHSSGTGSAIGGVFPQKSVYGSEYDSSYFFGDYSQNLIKRLVVNERDELVSSETFITDAGGPVDFQNGSDGSIYYLSIYTGEIRRIVRGNINHAPLIQMFADPTSGAVPLSVHFSSNGTTDPDGEQVSFFWNFGDGGTSVLANPDHVYESSGKYIATLTVTDARGLASSQNIMVSAGVTPPENTFVPHLLDLQINPNPSVIGRSVLIDAKVENSGTTGALNADFEIFNSGGTRVAQKVYENQTLGTGLSQNFTFNWFPAEIGTYRVAFGIFKNDWSQLYEWNDGAGSATIQSRTPDTNPISLDHVGTSALPSSLSGGASTVITSTIHNKGGAGTTLVDIEVYKNGEKVGQKFFDDVVFAAGETKTFSYTWTAGSDGDYRVALGIFKQNWSGLYSWVNEAANITVGSGISSGATSLYVDSLSSGVENWSWDTNVNFDSTEAVSEGTKSMAVEFQSPWAGLYLHKASIDTHGKTTLVFDLNGGSSGNQKLQILLFDASGNAMAGKSITPYLSQSLLNRWNHVAIPLADIGGQDKIISGIAIQGADGAVQQKFFIDSVLFR